MLNFLAAVSGNGAAAPSGAFESIATATVTSTGSQITFTSIPNTYQHLQLRYRGKDSFSSTGFTDLILWINNSFTANYTMHRLSGNGTSASAGAQTAVGSIYFPNMMPYNNNSNWSSGIIDIHDYAVASKNRVVRLFGGGDNNGSGWVALMSGMRESTEVITRLDISSGGNGFTVGSTVALYGIKGA